MSVSLDTIVDVTVEVSNPATISSDFSLGCIIGNSTVLTEANRIKTYSRNSYAEQMVEDGFAITSSEYKAAVAYFSQSPAPKSLVVGVKLENETDLQALTATRLANENIYAYSFSYTLNDASISAIAEGIESVTAPMQFFYQVSDTKVLQAGTDNVMKTLRDKKFSKACGFYSTQENFINGLVGVVCGLNSMEANSAYTLAYKSVTGFVAENVNDVQIAALTSYNGNTYCYFGNRYSFVYPGLMSDGKHVDEAFMLDAIHYLLQQYVVAGLTSRRVIPQTESGVTDIVSFVASGCEVLRTMGFIATGIWTGADVLELHAGDAVPGGYFIQAMSLAEQSASDRLARKSPTVYVAIKAAGAIEHVVIRVFVNS